MADVIPFKASHIACITGKPAADYLRATPVQLELLEQCPWSVTVLLGNAPVVSYGIVTHWPGRGEAWAVVNRELCRQSTAARRALVRGARHILARYLDQSPGHCRVEAVVKRDGFPEGHRLVERLGFRIETDRMINYGLDGSDQSMYVVTR